MHIEQLMGDGRLETLSENAEDYIEQIEEYITRCDEARGYGAAFSEDAYDTAKRILATYRKSYVSNADEEEGKTMLPKEKKNATPQEKAAYIQELEGFITKCRQAVNKGEELVPDSVYDAAIFKLKELNPNSKLLTENWTEDVGVVDAELDRQLVIHPMGSIQTIKSLDTNEMKTFLSIVAAQQNKNNGILDMHASMKMNGHGIRWVYKNGVFVKAHTRGRSSNGRDITHIISNIVPKTIPALANMGIVEIRGEVLLPYSNYKKALKYNPDIKSAFTGVSSLMADKAGLENWKLLKVVAYAVYSDKIQLNSMTDTYKFLQKIGFETPLYSKVTFNVGKESNLTTVNKVLQVFERKIEQYDYFTDGVVLSVDSVPLLESLGTTGNTRNGNVALKVGFWAQDMYSSVVEEIIWTGGRTKFTPVARVVPVTTASGATVQNIPLYAPIHIINLRAYIGNTIHFRFGGEAGVVPCYPDGKLVTDIS